MKTEDMSQKVKRSVPFLAQMWQANMARMNGVVEQKPLTPRQFGQLKLLRNLLEDITWDVMLWALENWTRFSQEAKIRAGLPCAPADPHIGFLLAHHEVAVNLMYKIAKSTNTVGAAQFIKNVDRLIYENLKNDAVKACEGDPELLAMVEAAKTLDDLHKIMALLVYRSSIQYLHLSRHVGKPT
jgi:hypothetical protein